ncbi:MAG: radical SAM protein [Syntrophorhabdales bacterium]
MRVLFISTNRSKIGMRTVPLGLACVAATARQAGHEVRVLDLLDVADVSEGISGLIRNWRPEVVGVSLRNIDDQSMASSRSFVDECNDVIEQVKRVSDAPVVLGGAGYSIFPEVALERSRADMGIWGEGEEGFRLLLERIEARQPLTGVPGLFVRGRGLQGARTFVKDLDRFPLPDHDLLDLPYGLGAVLPVQTRRGCPLACSYCSTEMIEGRIIRRRSPKKVVEWIAGWAERGIRQVHFVDNTFNLPVSYARDLCRELAAASSGVVWRCIVYPFHLDENLARLMADAGCVEVSFGFESGCDRMLKAMNKRFDLDDVRRTRRTLRTAGIKCMGFLLLGGPGETRDSVKESLSFTESLELDSLKVSVGVRIYPYTPLADQARREELVPAGDDLLYPRYYMVPGLAEWTRQTVAEYARERKNWIVDK